MPEAHPSSLTARLIKVHCFFQYSCCGTARALPGRTKDFAAHYDAGGHILGRD
jgi:hypothetical protein